MADFFLGIFFALFLAQGRRLQWRLLGQKPVDVLSVSDILVVEIVLVHRW
jgi:hypothetical protein